MMLLRIPKRHRSRLTRCVLLVLFPPSKLVPKRVPSESVFPYLNDKHHINFQVDIMS